MVKFVKENKNEIKRIMFLFEVAIPLLMILFLGVEKVLIGSAFFIMIVFLRVLFVMI